eukprot:1125654_1
MSSEINIKSGAFISQRYNNNVFVFLRNMERILNLAIPDLIQHLCLFYYYDLIDSSILTDSEKEQFLSLLEQHNKFDALGNYSWHLLYRANTNELDNHAFYNQCHGVKNIVCLIRTQRDDVFGGYTAIGWPKWHINLQNCSAIRDEKVFLFSVRSSKGYKPIIADIVPATSNGFAVLITANACCILIG